MLNQAGDMLKNVFHSNRIAYFGLCATALTISPAAAQTLPAVPKCTETNADCIEKRAEVRGARGDIHTARAAVEYKAEDADNALVEKLRVPVVPPPHHGSLLPFIDNAKIPAPSAGFTSARIKAATDTPKQNANGSGQFRFTCDFSHMNYDDPIVYAGKQGASHLHTFFGNTLVNYASTQTSIETTGNSTCGGGTANRTGYWVPAVIDTKDGTPLKPSKILVYYKNDMLPYETVTPYPAGLRMVAGDMRSTGPQDRTDWGCFTPDGKELRGKSIPACPVGGIVEATIEFPMCWNGKDLDSTDHKSHMAFIGWNNDLRKNMCPATHPVLLPALAEKVQYSVTEEGSTARWRLSSDNYGTDKPGGFSIHADWFNGWNAKVQDTWVKNCLNAQRDCHGFLLGDGTTLF